MRKPSLLTRFVLLAFGLVIAFTLLWTKISPWTSYPVAVLTHVALEQSVPLWVRTVHTKPGFIEVDTAVEAAAAQTGGRRGEITLEADPGRYAFGLPIFMALLVAARLVSRHKGVGLRAAAGYVLLLPAQTFSMVMYLLMQIAMGSAFSLQAMRVDMWQLEGIVYGYQVGVLVLPTLVPVLVWLWLDRRFFQEVIVAGWKQSLRA
ncbi:MAG: hypothetical protein EOO32_01245 [Comamonadaceae bacterium]|nr:MAG: hypothetical protein EOO32_01245 [Comamonadaceae bacterium]